MRNFILILALILLFVIGFVIMRSIDNFIESGGDISFLSDLLGHESIETTRIYLRRTSTEQARIFNQVVNW